MRRTNHAHTARHGKLQRAGTMELPRSSVVKNSLKNLFVSASLRSPITERNSI